MIEPTDEMRQAFAEAADAKCEELVTAGVTLATLEEGVIIRAGLAAVLALVERDYTIRPRRTGEAKFKGPRDHDFLPDDDPRFGAAFGGACGALVDTGTHGRVVCGWPRLAHRSQPATPPQ